MQVAQTSWASARATGPGLYPAEARPRRSSAPRSCTGINPESLGSFAALTQVLDLLGTRATSRLARRENGRDRR